MSFLSTRLIVQIVTKLCCVLILLVAVSGNEKKSFQNCSGDTTSSTCTVIRSFASTKSGYIGRKFLIFVFYLYLFENSSMLVNVYAKIWSFIVTYVLYF